MTCSAEQNELRQPPCHKSGLIMQLRIAEIVESRNFRSLRLVLFGARLASHKRLRELHLPNCDCRARVVSMHIFLEGQGEPM